MLLTAQFERKNGETFAKSSRRENYLVSTLKAQTRVQIPLGPPTFPLERFRDVLIVPTAVLFQLVSPFVGRSVTQSLNDCRLHSSQKWSVSAASSQSGLLRQSVLRLCR